MSGRWPLLVLALALAACSNSRPPAPIVERAPSAKPTHTPSAAPVARAARPGAYQVRPGDTLYGIAFARDLDFRDLARLNGLDEPYLIRPGQWLDMPRAPATTVTSTASAAVTAPLPSAPAQVVARPLAGQATTSPAATAQTSPAAAPEAAWQWPAKGRVFAEFDLGAGRKGLDIVGEPDSPIRAASSGVVVYSGSALRGYGKLTIIRHGSNLLTAYAHMSAQRVVEGQTVAAGQAIGAMGDSDSDRVKLHFEVREQGRPVNPRLYLPVRSEYGPG
jgi:lipoprotein NlpD